MIMYIYVLFFALLNKSPLSSRVHAPLGNNEDLIRQGRGREGETEQEESVMVIYKWDISTDCLALVIERRDSRERSRNERAFVSWVRKERGAHVLFVPLSRVPRRSCTRNRRILAIFSFPSYSARF